MARKKEQSEEILAPDPFMEQAGKGAAWFEKNFKLLIAGIVVALGGVLGVQVLQGSSLRSASAVTADLDEAVKAYSEATDLRTVLTSTSAEATQEGYQKAKEKFEAFRAKHPSHEATRLAKLYEGELARRMNKHAEAQAFYMEYLNGVKADDPLAFIALEGAGYSFEADGKLDDALTQFGKLEQQAPFFKDYALKHRARVLEKKGDRDGARAAYQAISDMEPVSGLKSFAEDRLKALP